MKNLFDNYTPQPQEKKLRFTPRMPELSTENVSDSTRKMKMSIPAEAILTNVKKNQEVKTDKSNQRTHRGENTTLF